MNPAQKIIEAANDLVLEARRANSFFERAALQALAATLANDLRDLADRCVGPHGDLHARLDDYRAHVAAALGFADDAGRDAEQHRLWALGALSSFEHALDEYRAG